MKEVFLALFSLSLKLRILNVKTCFETPDDIQIILGDTAESVLLKMLALTSVGQ